MTIREYCCTCGLFTKHNLWKWNGQSFLDCSVCHTDTRQRGLQPLSAQPLDPVDPAKGGE